MMRTHHFLLRASQRLNSIRIPAKAAMQLLTTLLVFSLCLFPNLATAATPHIYDTPQAGSPGSQTRTVGNGWDANATLDIYFDSTDVGLVDTDNNGSFGMALRAPTIRQNGLTIQIPKDALSGTHWITAVERITELQAQVPFTVRADWPQFHFGPDHTGFNPYENALNPETVGNLTMRWKRVTGGPIWTSPVVANGVVYFGSQDNNVYALDAVTRHQLWWYPGRMSGDTAPAVANGMVYFGSEDGNLDALNASTGAFLWKYPVGAAVLCSPAVANGIVYFGSNDYNLYALNASTGAFLWKYPTGQVIYAAPTVANGVVYVGSYDYKVYALDAGTGALLWNFATLYPIQGSPAVANGIVYVTSNDHNIYALEASTGALVWKYATGSFIDSSPAVANGVVYFGSGDRNMYALDASTGVLLWKYAPGTDIYSSPAVANGVVYVSIMYDNSVYALDASTGVLLWKYTTGGTVYSSPAVVNGMLYVGSYDGNLYAFGLPNQQMSEKFSPPERPDPARLTPDWTLQPNAVVTPAKK